MSDVKLWDYMDEFVKVFTEQLKEDNERWGDTWLHRTRNGQELRVKAVYDNYFDKFIYANKPIHWLAVIGNAYIAWVRENHPELFSE